MSARFWTNARLLTATALVIMTATLTAPPQDWIPFHVAGRLAPAGEWQALYPPTGARSLFDVTRRYRDVASTTVSQGGQPAYPEGSLTAFVSSPPAAFATAPLSRLSWPSGVVLWRLALAVPLVLSLLLVGAATADLRERARWSWIALASTPLLSYVVYVGQPSAWLLVAAALSVMPVTRGRDIAGGVALGLGVIFKATPILIVAGLWVGGRRRMAAVAASLTALVCIGTLPWTVEGWTGFRIAASRLASVVIPDWNNGSFDAALIRLTSGTTNVFIDPGVLVTAGAWILRLALVALALRTVIDGRRPPRQRVAALWIGWLASSPLLWLHYFVALVPLAGAAPARRIDPGVILVAVFGAIVAGRVGGLPAGWSGMALCAAWLAGAAWLLSNRCWNAE